VSTGIERLNSLWREHNDAFIEALWGDIVARGGPSYAAMPREQLLDALKRTVQAWQTSLEANDPTALTDHIHTVGLQRAASGVGVDEIMQVVDVTRDHIWKLMAQVFSSGDWDIDTVEQVERWLHEERKAIVSGYRQTWTEASERLAERERAVETQRHIIQELSTPIVPIYEGVLVLPLVGAVDSRRATQVMESVLEQIVAYQAEVLILDITGVPVVDTGVASHLLQMARAVTLLGARVILVGIGAEIAQTIVQLGVDLNNITTLANLEAGIAHALARRGYAITPIAA
jgi:rsbT co-antagonist protein RsbR